ncbi:SDR family NAD(P)-dependent oxidoreductase [Nonomuraea africana]|uniref:NAD(P)-dependent dehydrogenase (Short-subunit alcohol dehydrogenase family) n=1 Tax=Nonomuraea africana TaxID=46171 RepID=A0ABR9K7Q8_9ACTN|nr:SDR family oxidoreductase [Nonomuraea africana]MBE1558039.1 NAD(P)-dependent dehydrogenase (short-subunit alcohol dehydrogenase family) [Nonomuraea africana]
MSFDAKNVVIYGAAGSIGSSAAEAYAREGARVFLAGRTRATLEKVAQGIEASGGRAEVDVVDVLDEQAVDAFAASVVARGGSLDVSLNLASRGDVQGIPLAQMSVEDFVKPITTGITTTFITARAAARHMIEQGSGVILALNSGSANVSPMMGGTGPLDAAMDSFIRNLALELGPSGVRALSIWVAAVPETFTPEKLAAVNAEMQMDEAAIQGLLKQLAEMRMLRRNPTLEEVTRTILFLTSDAALGITGTSVNVTGGMFAN